MSPVRDMNKTEWLFDLLPFFAITLPFYQPNYVRSTTEISMLVRGWLNCSWSSMQWLYTQVQVEIRNKTRIPSGHYMQLQITLGMLVHVVWFTTEISSHGFLSHSIRKYNIVIIAVTSSLSSAITYYSTPHTAWPSLPDSRPYYYKAAVQKVKKSLLSGFSDFIFILFLSSWDTSVWRQQLLDEPDELIFCQYNRIGFCAIPYINVNI